MKNKSNKIGILATVAITAIALGMVGSISATQDDSIQQQGEIVIDRTTKELQNIPEDLDELTTKTLDQTEELITDVPKVVNNVIEESDSASEVVDNTADLIEEVLPDVPKVVQQNDGDLLKLVSISLNAETPECSESNTCFMPKKIVMARGGEVIWTNNDVLAHTVTAGNPGDGPNGLFDSGLIMPNKTYSIKPDIPFEYEYFCLAHPWEKGTIIVR
jgi:plastocyanin